MTGNKNFGVNVLLLAAMLMTLGCQTERCPEEPPTLSFYQFQYLPADPTDPFASDSLTLVLEFSDCQGDVGIGSGSEKNLHTYLYEKLNGDWVRFAPADSADTSLLFAQIPFSSKLKEGQKAQGLIEQPFGSIKQTSDTIRFHSRLFDREGNKSEEVITPEFVFPN